MMEPTEVPKVFALTRDVGDSCFVVGYGLVLPDGSAYSVSWPSGPGSSFYSASSAEQTATLRGADLMWLDLV